MANIISNAIGDVANYLGNTSVGKDIGGFVNDLSGGGGTNYGTPATKTVIGGGNTAGTGSSTDPALLQANAGLAAAQQQSSILQQEISQLEANVPGTAHQLNINAINASAQGQAQSTVNPLYTSYLNQYLQNEAANQQAAQSQNTLNLQAEQSGLGNTLAQNTLSQQAAASTNALTQGNINAQSQNYELNSGMAQNQKLQAIGAANGSSNLSSSGLGSQAIWEAENTKNVADAQQQGQFQYDRNTSNLSTQDTFAQLAQSSAYATTAEGQQEAQTNFNLTDYLRQAAANDTQYRQANSALEQQAQNAAQWNYAAQDISSQIQALQPQLSAKDLAATQQFYAPYETQQTAPSVTDLAGLSNTYSTAGYGAAV